VYTQGGAHLSVRLGLVDSEVRNALASKLRSEGRRAALAPVVRLDAGRDLECRESHVGSTVADGQDAKEKM
jgi:hypothetical protein